MNIYRVSWWNWWLFLRVSSLRQNHLESFETNAQHMSWSFVTSSYILRTNNVQSTAYALQAARTAQFKFWNSRHLRIHGPTLASNCKTVRSCLRFFSLTSMNPWDGGKNVRSPAVLRKGGNRLEQTCANPCSHVRHTNTISGQVSRNGWGNITKGEPFFHQIWTLFLVTQELR